MLNYFLKRHPTIARKQARSAPFATLLPVQAAEAEQMQRAAAEMLAHHQQLAALEHSRHTSMLQNMQVHCIAIPIL